MHSILSISILALATAVAAQDQTILVGPGANFIFQPNNINATQGSVITFAFTGSPGDHSVSQSSFADPCSEISGGFDSGFVSVPSGLTSGPFAQWNLTITNASQPIWFYCKQVVPSPHCIAGMVGGINVPGSGAHSFQAFQSAAEALQSFPPQTSGSLSGVGAFATISPSTVTNSIASPSPTSPASGATSSSATSSSATTTTTNTATSGTDKKVQVAGMGVGFAALLLGFYLA